MNTSRRTSIAAGALFILATIAALAAASVVPSLTGTDYLTAVADQPNRVAAAAVLYLIAAGSSVGITIALYPLLKQVNAVLALGSVVFRTIEAVFYTAAVVSLLSILPLARSQDGALASVAATTQVAADALLSVRDSASVVGVFAFCVGSVLYSLALLEARAIPRWLSGWGVLASLTMFTACLLSVFSGQPITGYVPLIIPIFVQEMVLAGWLLVKGFAPRRREALAPVEAQVAA